MQLIVDGHPIVHRHKCAKSRIGQPISQKELNELAVQAIITEYKQAGRKSVVKHDFDFNSGADFSFETAFGTICGKVVYAQDYNIDLRKIDCELLYKKYRNGNILPRLYLATANCISSENGEMLCGGEYVFNFHIETLMRDEVKIDLPSQFDEADLIKQYILFWETGRKQFILPYLHPKFRSYHLSGFDPLVSRKEYLLWFDAVHLRANNGDFSMTLAKHSKKNELGVLVSIPDKTTKYFIAFKTDSGRIKMIWSRVASKYVVPYDPEKELYQSHYDHIEAIMPYKRLFEEIVAKTLRNNQSYRVSKFLNFDFLSYRHVCAGNDYLIITKRVPNEERNEILSVYPYLPGNKFTAKVIDVLEWETGAEATILAEVNGFKFAFFATDYYIHYERYAPESIIEVQLSALGIRVNPGMKEFSFDGEQAQEFLKKCNQDYEVDENGNVKPLHFSLKNLVSYLNIDERCPDEGEFQSPIQNMEVTNFIGNKFLKCEITLNRIAELKVPLYFSASQIPDYSNIECVGGWLWLMGRLTKR